LDVALVIKQRLAELGLDQRDLAAATQVTHIRSFIYPKGGGTMDILIRATVLGFLSFPLWGDSVQLIPDPSFGNPEEVSALQDFLNYASPAFSGVALTPSTAVLLLPTIDGIAHPGCLPEIGIAFWNNLQGPFQMWDLTMYAIVHEVAGLNPCNQKLFVNNPYNGAINETYNGAVANCVFSAVSRTDSRFPPLTSVYMTWLSHNYPRDSAAGGSNWYDHQTQAGPEGIWELLTGCDFRPFGNTLNQAEVKGGELDSGAIHNFAAYLAFLDKNLPSFNGLLPSELFGSDPAFYFNGPDGDFPLIEVGSLADELTPNMAAEPDLYKNSPRITSPVLNGPQYFVVRMVRKTNGQVTYPAGLPMLVTAYDWTNLQLWQQPIVTGGWFEFPHMDSYEYGAYRFLACSPDPNTPTACDAGKPSMTTYALSLKGASDRYNPSKFYYWVNGPDTWAQMSPALTLSIANADPSVSSTLNHGIFAGDFGGSTNPITVCDGSRCSIVSRGVASQFLPWTPFDQPLISTNGVINGVGDAGLPAGVLSPNQIFSVYGLGFGSDHAKSAGASPLPMQLGRVQVNMLASDGKTYSCPLLYASHSQINAVVPANVPMGAAQVTVIVGITPSNSQAITISQTAPGIFLAGNGLGAIIHQDGSPVTATNPAIGGEHLSIFCTGLGQTNPTAKTGMPATAQTVISNTTVTWGGKTLQPEYAGLAPGFSGLYQVNILVPNGITSSNLFLTSGGQNSNTVWLP